MSDKMCEEKVKNLLANLKKVNRSRERHRAMNEIMRMLIVEMLINSKGWIYDDIDGKAIDILNNYQKIKDGV
jgi:hypothetical protein